MASTYSPSLKLELIGNGDQSGTWGTTTNNNLGTLLEQAITGVQNITMLNADYVLTNYNGTSDEARNAVLVVGGINSAIRQIVAPLVNKLYVVTNNTSGGYAITVGGVSGSAVTIPNGVTAQVYCNGTNFYSAQTGSAGNFTVNGTLTATGLTDTGNMNVGGNLTVTGSITAGSINGLTGRIVQTVSSTITTGFTTTSTSFVSTGHTASITPSSTSSKIMCFVTAELGQAGTNLNTHMTLFRDSTNLAGSGNAFCEVLSSAGNIYANAAINYLDSPATTSSITYSTQILVNGGTGIYNPAGTGVTSAKAVITLMEIL